MHNSDSETETIQPIISMKEIHPMQKTLVICLLVAVTNIPAFAADKQAIQTEPGTTSGSEQSSEALAKMAQNSRIDQIGTEAADAIATRIRQDVSAKISDLDSSKLTETELLIRQQATNRLEREIVEQDRDLRGLVRDGAIRRNLTQGRVAKALENYVRAEVQARANTTEERLQSKAAAAKKKLAKAIADEIKTSTPTYASGDKWWIDPIIGLRGQFNLTRWLYFAAQADVGGFSAVSQIAWNVQSTIGINFTRNIFAELGYRYYYVDYENGGFVYDMNSYGVFSSVGFKF